MKLTVFGSTGDAGRRVIDKALAAGHEVVAYARNPNKLDTDHQRLSVIAGELDDAEAIDRAVHGADAVISLLGPRPSSKGTPITAGTRRIIVAMTRHGVLRLIATATPSAVAPEDRSSLRFYMGATFVRFVLPHVYRDILGTA